MGISIYYQAQREHPFTEQEEAAIDEIVRRHSASTVGPAEGPGWEDFCIYPNDEHTEEGVIFEGATKLPMGSEDEFWQAIQHWCRVLTLIRRVLPDATWSVHLDDANVYWDEERREYDPSVDAGNA